MNIALTLDDVYIDVGILSAVLSLIGCCFILATYIGFKSLRTTGSKILVYLTLADVGVCVSHIVAASTVLYYREFSYRSFAPCAVAAAFTIMSRISSYLWTCALSLNILLRMSKKREYIAELLMVPFYVVCWIFPIAIAIAALFSDALGFDLGPVPTQNRPPWCWIDRRSSDYLSWSFLAGAGWQWGSILLCLIFYAAVQWHTVLSGRQPQENSNDEDPTSREHEEEESIQPRIPASDKRLHFVPLVFIVLQVWGAWGYLAMLLKPSPNWLVVLQEIGNQGQGLANALLWCVFTKSTRIKICGKLCAICCWCGKCTPCTEKKLRIPVEMEQLAPQGPEAESLMTDRAHDSEEEQ